MKYDIAAIWPSYTGDEPRTRIFWPEGYIGEIEKETKKLSIPFYPNISVGWDNNVRFNKLIPGVVENNTPEKFKSSCERIKDFADSALENGIMKAPFITVNSRNKWTETSYLEAIKEVDEILSVNAKVLSLSC